MTAADSLRPYPVSVFPALTPQRRGSYTAVAASTEVSSINPSAHVMPTRRVVPDRVWARELVRDVLPALLLTRLVFVALTLLIPLWRTATGLGRFTLYRATGTAFDEWNRWDTRWYDDLARLGYNLHGPNDYENVAFFPPYPLLLRTLPEALAIVGRDVLGLAPKDPFYPPYLVPGMIVANLCAVAAL